MARTSKKQEEVVNVTRRGTTNDFDIIIEPLITEKTMNQSQEKNKATFIVKKGANKIAIKKAIITLKDGEAITLFNE